MPNNTDTPLEGKIIAITRAREQAAKLADRLDELGATVIELPTIEIKTTPDPLDLDPTTFDWIVFASGNAARNLHEKLTAANVPFAFGSAKVCAVGPATREALNDLGVTVDLVPDPYTAEGAMAALNETDLAGKNILLPQGNISRPYLREALTDSGANVTAPIVYETSRPDTSEQRLDEVTATLPDWITFTSASTVRNFAAMMGPDRIAKLDDHTRFAAIGPQTAAEAEAAGLPIAVQPDQHDIEGLCQALVQFHAS